MGERNRQRQCHPPNSLGPGLYFIKRFKTDQGKNLTGGIIQEISKRLGIWEDMSSAYNPAGNRLAENTVKKIKKAIGNRKIEDATQDIIASVVMIIADQDWKF